MALTRKQISQIYRPQGPKAISLGYPFTAAGANILISNAQVDLSVPLEGLRLIIKLRDVIAVAGMTTPSPLGYLNMLSRILITGKNSRAGGNVTLLDMDLATLVLIQASVQHKPFFYNGVSILGAPLAGSEVAKEQPSTPIANFFTGAVGTYDIRLAVDIPFFPPEAAPFTRVGYLVRAQEWADSVQIRITTPAIANGATHALGVDAAGTTHVFTAFGSAAGSPTVDIYGLPVIMGVDLDAVHAPGFLTRIATPIAAVLQAAGGPNTRLAILEKKDTTRVWTIVGTSAVNPSMITFSDVNLSTLGMIIAGNKIVRENDDVFAHKMDQTRRYGTQPIQGLTMFDFVPSGNPDAGYDSGSAGEGTILELRGTVAGVANALGIIVQETEQYAPGGPLYAA